MEYAHQLGPRALSFMAKITQGLSKEQMAAPPSRNEVYPLLAMLLDGVTDNKASLRQLCDDRVSFRGTWQASAQTQRGDLMTHNGALWFCTKTGTTDRPGDGTGWQLAVKQGAVK